MFQHDERLEAVVNRMFERCIEDKEYKQVFHMHQPSLTLQALGVAIESRRSDTITQILQKSKDPSLLGYVLEVAMTHVRHIKWRNEILEIIVEMQRQQNEPDYFAICTCVVHLNDAESAAHELLELTEKGGDVLPHFGQADNRTI